MKIQKCNKSDNGNKTCLYNKTGIYTGSIKNGKKEGQGTMKYNKNNKKSGMCKGSWKNDKLNGQAKCVNIYRLKGKLHNYTCKGSYKNDKLNGQANTIHIYKDKRNIPRKSTYKGSFKNNEKNGQGQSISIHKKKGKPNNYTCKGPWKNGLLTGKAKCVHKYNGKKYEYIGQFKNSKINGRGTIEYTSGKYIGQLKNNIMSGKGIFIWKDGSKHIGYWKNDKKNGRGVYIEKNGEITRGIWKNNKRISKSK
jgi:hypothetical protein